MKSLVAALILFSVLLGCIIFNGIYVRNTCNEISKLCQSLQSGEDKSSISSNILAIWKKSKPLLELSIRMSEIERMSDLIEGLHSSVILKNEAEIKKYCSLIIDHANDIAKQEGISLSSIF